MVEEAVAGEVQAGAVVAVSAVLEAPAEALGAEAEDQAR